MLFTILSILIILIAVLLVLVVLVQNPKEGGLSSSAFGGNAQALGGVQKSGNLLERITWILAGALAVLVLASNIFLQKPQQTPTSGSNLEQSLDQAQQTIPQQQPATPQQEEVPSTPPPTTDGN